ncbi:Fumarylacetoacetate hydrolase domain-containing protein 2 [Nymphon striatum]|nr:Fumarylacetoacetate hydrolase domain-containing protein 2 [Nymphon striatum]
MRFVQFFSKNCKRVQLGLELSRGGDVVSLSNDSSLPCTMMEFLEKLEDNLIKAKRVLDSKDRILIPRSSIDITAPITKPDKVLCVGMNYKDHCEEQNVPLPVVPIIFNKFPSCIVGPTENIPVPEITEELDWEVELVIVVGKKCKNVSEKDADEYIFGYTAAHDVSARDWQLKKNGGQWLVGKAMDAFCPLGPCIVTKDSIDANNLDVSTRVNGIVKQKSNTCQLVHKSSNLISFCSKFVTLLPGDVILTGTPGGVGIFRKPPEFLKGIRNAKSIFIKKQSEDLIIKAKEHGIKALFRHVKRKTPSSSASIQAMYQHCKNLFTSEEPLTPEITKIPSCENENHPLLFTISLQEVEAALKQARSRACSISGYLSPHSLKLLLPGIAPILHILFNHFLVNSTFPSCWLEAIFFFLHKKGDRNEPSNYRTIAIENPFLKVFMLWLTSRLSSFCESENILPDMQFGFRHNRSCISATSMLHHVVHSRLSNKKRTYAAFIDFSRAFDSIDRSLLFTKLQILGIPFLVCKLLHHILFNLKYRIRQDSLLSASFQCDKGTPQGDPLSPLLFSLFLADLPDYLDFDGLSFPNSSVKIHLLMYADDIVLLAEDANQLQTALDCLFKYCQQFKLQINVEKSKFFVFHKGRLPKCSKGDLVEIEIQDIGTIRNEIV